MRSPVTKKTHLYPFIITALTVVFDQLTKYLVVKSIPLQGVGFTMLNDFFRIIHVRNLGMAFSMGHDLSTNLRTIGLIVLPLIVMAVVVVYFFKTDELTLFQRYILCGILGGGIGNVAIDRIFRPEGVVDFISVKFYGFLGMQYFPTFNIADSVVVVSGILMLISIIIQSHNESMAKSEK